MIGILGAAFLYYFSLFYLSRKLDLQRLYVLVALASLPMLALRVLSFIGSPINLIGFFVTCFLTIVGLRNLVADLVASGSRAWRNEGACCEEGAPDPGAPSRDGTTSRQTETLPSPSP